MADGIVHSNANNNDTTISGYFTYIVQTTSDDGGPDANLNVGVAHHP